MKVGKNCCYAWLLREDSKKVVDQNSDVAY